MAFQRYRMRDVSFLIVALVLICRPTIAAATSCDEPEWQRHGELVVVEDVPVNAHPWRFFPCGFDPATCTLEAEGYSETVDLVRLGSNCRVSEAEPAGFGEVIEYVPRSPLVVGRTYTLNCPVTSTWDDTGENQFTVRESDAPATAPEEVELRDIRITRGQDGGCCTTGDELVVSLARLDAPYLREGGRIELRYPTGEVFPIATDAAPELHLPLTGGPLEFTPVAADGVRGVVLRIEPDDIGEREAVYIPCSVARRHAGAAWWLLAPLLWIAARRRRA